MQADYTLNSQMQLDLEPGKIYEISFKYGVACISSTFEPLPSKGSYEVSRDTDTVILIDFIDGRMYSVLKCLSMRTNELLVYEFYKDADKIRLLV
jgi:hypothetical protein